MANTPSPFFRMAWHESPVLARYNHPVTAGIPATLQDDTAEELNLNTYLMPTPATTFVMRVEGDSMIDAHLPHNCLIVVDRSIEPSNNQIVVAMVNGAITVKRFIKNSSGIRLMPANDKYKPIPITDQMEFSIWGTVTRIIIDTLAG